ncbi:MAG: alpha/beta hydrolase family protein [Chthoniobacterales bacterium]
MSKSDLRSDAEPRRWRVWLRVLATVLAIAACALLAVVAWIYFSQHSMIYHPRPYPAAYARVLPKTCVEIDYVLPIGRQTAFYLPGRDRIPKRLWLAFCGNGSLALDWTGLLDRYPPNGDGFLLIDYPGYGRNAGYATIDSTRATTNGALKALMSQLNITKDQMELAVIGHSLGAAAALDFAARHSVRRAVLISPFTSLREEAAYVVGRWLSHLLIENYDNRKNLRTVFERNSDVQVAIFHGTDDDTIPVGMGAELKQGFPRVDYFPIDGADHGTVLSYAKNQIIAWMAR